MGFGCLYERVEHGITGFLAKNKREFIEYSSLILNDNSVYLEIKKIIKQKNSRNYNHVKNDSIKILRINENSFNYIFYIFYFLNFSSI